MEVNFGNCVELKGTIVESVILASWPFIIDGILSSCHNRLLYKVRLAYPYDIVVRETSRELWRGLLLLLRLLHN